MLSSSCLLVAFYSLLSLHEAVPLESHEPISLAETDDPPLGECLLRSPSEISKIRSLVYPHLWEPCCVRLLTQGCRVVCACVLRYM